MTEKEEFITALKNRTKKFASVITYQIVKSATSTGANYRAACRARSSNEFFSKICIVVEEIDETEYWLEIIKNAKLTKNLTELNRLFIEANELVKIMSKAKSTASDRKNNKH